MDGKQDALTSQMIAIAQQLGIVEENKSLDQTQVLMLAEAIKVKIKASAAALEQANSMNADLIAALELGNNLANFTGSLTLRLATDDTVATLLTELRTRIEQFQQRALHILDRIHAAE